jgi:hypothetical protein
MQQMQVGLELGSERRNPNFSSRTHYTNQMYVLQKPRNPMHWFYVRYESCSTKQKRPNGPFSLYNFSSKDGSEDVRAVSLIDCFEMQNRFIFWSVFVVSSDLSIGKNSDVILVFKTDELSETYEFFIIFPGNEMILITRIEKTLNDAFKRDIWRNFSNYVILSA